MFSQLPQMLSQAPQMLGQLIQMPMGMMGSLTSSLGGMTGGADPAMGGLTQASMTSGTASLGGGGGGGGMGMPGGAPVASTFTRPASSFNAPAAPKLPGGWNGASAVPEPVAAGPSGMGGGGGLYGSPAAVGRDQGTSSEKAPARQMRLTAHPAASRGDRHQN
jgi:hypothetical protein